MDLTKPTLKIRFRASNRGSEHGKVDVLSPKQCSFKLLNKPNIHTCKIFFEKSFSDIFLVFNVSYKVAWSEAIVSGQNRENFAN